MRENKKLALFASLFALIGIPLIFLIVSLYTGNWRALVISIGPALTAGITGMTVTIIRAKEGK